MFGRNDYDPPNPGSILTSDMMRFVAMTLIFVVEPEQLLKDRNMCIPHVEYKDTPHGKNIPRKPSHIIKLQNCKIRHATLKDENYLK